MSEERTRQRCTVKRRAAYWLGSLALLALVVPASALPKVKTNAPIPSDVVRPAPDFMWVGAGGKLMPVKNFRGQPVVILVAPSPEAAPLRKEAARIEELYLRFSAKQTIFLAAFTRQTGRVQSNVPFAIAANGAEVASAYGVPSDQFAVIVISPDGNVDMVSTKVEGAQRILDVIDNSYQAQASHRHGL